MVIKSGYKQTEVGVIPEDWGLFTLSELCNQITDGSHFSPEPQVIGKIIVNVKDIIDGRIEIDNCTNISNADFDSLVRNGCSPKPGDILLSKDGSIGEVVVYYLNIRVVCLSSIAILTPDKNKLNSNYLGYYLKSNIIYNQLNKIKTGSALKRIILKDINKLIITVPYSVNEQEAIANTLSDADALIQSLERLIAKKRDIKQGAMQQLLTAGVRLPGFEGEWETKNIEEICRVKKGDLITEAHVVTGDIPVIAGGKQPAYYHNTSNRNRNTITISASGANAGYISFYKFPIFASDCSTIEESDKYNIKFIYYSLLLQNNNIMKMQTGGAQPHIHPRDINKVTIHIPSLNEQAEIANILSDMDSEIEALEHKLSKYIEIKQGMMQELLTGRIRLA